MYLPYIHTGIYYGWTKKNVQDYISDKFSGGKCAVKVLDYQNTEEIKPILLSGTSVKKVNMKIFEPYEDFPINI